MNTNNNTESSSQSSSHLHSTYQEASPKYTQVGNQLVVDDRDENANIASLLNIKPLVFTDDVKYLLSLDARVIPVTNKRSAIARNTNLTWEEVKEIRQHPQFQMALSEFTTRLGALIGATQLSARASRLRELQLEHDNLNSIVEARQLKYENDIAVDPEGNSHEIPGISSGLMTVKFNVLSKKTSVTDRQKEVSEGEITESVTQQSTERSFFEAVASLDTNLLAQLSRIKQQIAEEMGHRSTGVNISLTTTKDYAFDVPFKVEQE